MYTRASERPPTAAIRYRRGAALLVAVSMVGVLLTAAPPASAGCQDFGPFGSLQQLCDGPIQPDGTWQRCAVTRNPIDTTYSQNQCFPLGGNHFLPPFEPPDHIDP